MKFAGDLTLTTAVASQQDQVQPQDYELSANYPNPFNPSTIISYQLPEVSNVTIKVYDRIGREITTLVNKRQQTGRYQVRFDASGLSSGVYFYRLVASGKAGQRFVQTRKFSLLK